MIKCSISLPLSGQRDIPALADNNIGFCWVS
jgi:hypothetical protein